MIIDESLEPTKGRSKFGVKLWVLAELVTGYIMHLNVYNERQHDPTLAGILQGSYVVNMLLKCTGLLRKGYHIINDSFFTSINLARELIDKDTFLTGTLCAKRPMPNSIRNLVLGENQCVYVRQSPILFCVNKERQDCKPVQVLSTSCTAI